MYKDILEEITCLKVTNVIKAAGVSYAKFKSLEEKPYGTKKETYRSLLKELKVLAEVCRKVRYGEATYKEYPDYFKASSFTKMSEEDVTEYFDLVYKYVAKAYKDLLARYKSLKEEEDFQDLEETVTVNMFVEDEPTTHHVTQEVTKEVPTLPRVASTQARADFMRMEAGIVKKRT